MVNVYMNIFLLSVIIVTNECMSQSGLSMNEWLSVGWTGMYEFWLSC